MISPGILSTNKSFEDSIINDEEININMNKTENVIIKEKKLFILFDSFETSYLEKNYEDLIKNIEEKEGLLYKNSNMSFKIIILKIKGYLKLLMIEYNNYLIRKNKTFYEINEIIHKIQKEFKITAILLNTKDLYSYEITTQIYCKFLYLLSKISAKKEDYLKSLVYITLGINMLKIYFMKKKIASDIKTYKIYCKLVLEIINILIGDFNYEQALYYIRLLFKIIQTSIKIIYYNNGKNSKIIPLLKLKKFLNLGGIGYLYAGCCLEQLEAPIQAFEAFKQAKFFFKKGTKLGFSFQNFNIINVNNSCSFLLDEVFQKLKLKLEKEKRELLNKQKIYELQMRKEKLKLLHKEKIMKLKNIANGIGENPFKFQKLENKFFKNIFPSSLKNKLENIDDELSSLVFSYCNKKSTKDAIISPNNKKISKNTKKLMSRFEACNILMSKPFRKFILKTKKLEFYNPKSALNSISNIQTYLNNKMKIKFNLKQKNIKKRNSPELDNNIIKIHENITSLITNKNKNQIIAKNNEEKMEKKHFRKIIKFRNKQNSLNKQDKTNEKNNSQITTPHSLSFNEIKGRNYKKIKYYSIKPSNELEKDF